MKAGEAGRIEECESAGNLAHGGRRNDTRGDFARSLESEVACQAPKATAGVNRTREGHAAAVWSGDLCRHPETAWTRAGTANMAAVKSRSPATAWQIGRAHV